METVLTDSQIIQLIQNGQYEYYSELVTRHEQKIIVYIRYMLKNNPLENMAEDLSQETFIKAYRAIDKFRNEEAEFTTWLYTIARNTVLSELRKHKNIVHLNIEDDTNLFQTDFKELPESKLLQNERIRMVREAIDELPSNQRSVIILREYEQMDYQEISEVMGSSVSAVKSLIYRARIAIKYKLENYINSPSE